MDVCVVGEPGHAPRGLEGQRVRAGTPDAASCNMSVGNGFTQIVIRGSCKI